MSKPEDKLSGNPGQGEADLSLLTEAERYKLLFEWNNTKTDYPKDKCIHELFEEQVSRTPDSIALIFDERRLTYSELNGRANQLAHYLRSIRVGPEVLVGICMERSVEMIVAILGILKAGGAYVPLDPAYPQERLAFMLEDTHLSVLLTQQRLIERLPENTSQLVCLDADWPEIANKKVENLGSLAKPENIAYVLYTSGSTGRPKGVTMHHRPLSNLLSWQLQNWTSPGEATTLQFASPSFDVSFQEIFSTFCSGGKLVLIPEDLRQDAKAFLHFLTEKGIERLFVPNVALQLLADEVQVSGAVPSSLREVITAGEQLRITPQIASLFRRLKNCTLCNQYGPSESHVVTAFSLQGSPDDWAALPPIGRPIANSQIYLLDRQLKPVPIGVAGELYIGGDSLARNYLNRPELTAERFVANPFSAAPGARLYQTGDLARYLPSGEIEYLGRVDHQVKIRGYRIELGEIEVAISQYPSVRQNVVIAREDRPGDKRLVAYIVMNDVSTGTVSELRAYLTNKLPAYMVPSAFVELQELPLTPNGKVSRRTLPEPNYGTQLQGSYLAPRDGIELKLAGIWESVLGTARVGVRDSFFELGGDSLLAARIFSETNRVFGMTLPLATVFQGDTIEQMAALLRQNQIDDRERRWSSLVPIQSGGSKRPFFCVHGEGGNVVSFKALSHYLGPDQPFYGLQSVGLDGKTLPLTSIQAMASHYIKAISDFQPQGPYFLGGLSLGGAVAFEMACQLHKQGREVGCVALLDTSLRGEVKLTERIGMHVTQLLISRRRIDYARRVAEAGKKKLKEKLGRKKLTASYYWYRDSEDQIPQLFRQMRENNHKAWNEYVLPTYPGKVALFRSDDRSLLDNGLLGWDEFAAEVDLYTTSGNHVTFIKEPHVRVLAEQLKKCLSRASSVDRTSTAENEALAFSASHG